MATASTLVLLCELGFTELILFSMCFVLYYTMKTMIFPVKMSSNAMAIKMKMLLGRMMLYATFGIASLLCFIVMAYYTEFIQVRDAESMVQNKSMKADALKILTYEQARIYTIFGESSEFEMRNILNARIGSKIVQTHTVSLFCITMGFSMLYVAYQWMFGKRWRRSYNILPFLALQLICVCSVLVVLQNGSYDFRTIILPHMILAFVLFVMLVINYMVVILRFVEECSGREVDDVLRSVKMRGAVSRYMKDHPDFKLDSLLEETPKDPTGYKGIKVISKLAAKYNCYVKYVKSPKDNSLKYLAVHANKKEDKGKKADRDDFGARLIPRDETLQRPAGAPPAYTPKPEPHDSAAGDKLCRTILIV